MARPISAKYQRRAASVGRETNRLRGETAKLLNQGLKDATEDQLYKRTPLPVSRDMFNSIRLVMKGNSVQVGYLYGRGSKYAAYRVNMKGTSVAGGHSLDMRPSEWIRKHVDPQIKKRARAAQKRIIEK